MTSFQTKLRVDDQTPPTDLTHTGDDKIVDVNNSIVFYQTLIRNKIPAEMHLYPKGDHAWLCAFNTHRRLDATAIQMDEKQ